MASTVACETGVRVALESVCFEIRFLLCLACGTCICREVCLYRRRIGRCCGRAHVYKAAVSGFVGSALSSPRNNLFIRLSNQVSFSSGISLRYHNTFRVPLSACSDIPVRLRILPASPCVPSPSRSVSLGYSLLSPCRSARPSSFTPPRVLGPCVRVIVRVGPVPVVCQHFLEPSPSVIRYHSFRVTTHIPRTIRDRVGAPPLVDPGPITCNRARRAAAL